MNFPLGNPSKVEFSDELKLEFLLSFGVSAALSDIIDVQFCPNTRKLLIHTIPSLIDSLQPASSQLISVICFFRLTIDLIDIWLSDQSSIIILSKQVLTRSINRPQ